MATRIDIELTSQQDDGRTFTWRAAGARQPKGTADAALFPAGSDVGDAFKVETEMGLDGIQVVGVVPTKEKQSGSRAEVLELLSDDDGPLVTQQLAEGRRGRGGGGRDGGRGRPRRDRDGGRREGGGRGEGGRGRGGDRPRTPPKPKLPPKPKPARLKAGRAHRKALLEGLPDAEKAVAEELLGGGLQAVRQGLATQNEQRRAEGTTPIDEGPIMTLAERLLVQVRAAEWLDRAEAALEQAATVDLRDLRSVVTAADGAAKDEETRALAARLRSALAERLESDQQAWVSEVVEMLDDDRVVRALHLSSRPPKAGSPLPPPVAMRLVEAASAAMNAEITAERWTHVLEALAHSPVRRQVVPVSLPATVTDELRSTIARFGGQLPGIAQIFGIEPDPGAGRAPRRRRRKPSGTGSRENAGSARAGRPEPGDAGAENAGTENPGAENAGTENPGAENAGTENPGAENAGTGDAEPGDGRAGATGDSPGAPDPERST